MSDLTKAPDAELLTELARIKGEIRRRQRESAKAAGTRLTILRESFGLSQGGLAIKCNITQAAVSLAESGKRPIMAQILIRKLSKQKPK